MLHPRLHEPSKSMSPAKSANATPTPPDTPSMFSSGPLELEVVATYQEFLTLRYEWDALAALQCEASIFLHHGWVDAAWRWCRHEGNPLVLVVRHSRELRGIVPLLATKKGNRGRCLSWLSVPDNQECDLICAPEQRETVAAAFSEWLAHNTHLWSGLALPQVRTNSPSLTPLLSKLRTAGMPVAHTSNSINYSIDLTTDWQSFYGNTSRRLKKGNNLVANRLKNAGSIEVTRITGADITPEVVDTLVRLSTASWKKATGTTFDHPGPRDFLEGLVERGTEGEWLVVWLLRLNGKVLASEVHVEHGHRVHALRADYAEDATELSPGTYLNWKVMEQLFHRGLARYELGPGDNPYKQRWTDGGLELTTVNAWPPTPAGRIQALWHTRVRPALSALKDRYRGSNN